MKTNINSFPCLIELGKDFYECEFDHKSLDVLQTVTGFGFYEIYDRFLFKENLPSKTLIDLLAVSVFKHHGAVGMQKVKAKLIAQPEIDLTQLATFKVHFKNLMPETQTLKADLNYLIKGYKPETSSSSEYDFEGSYALAKNFLKWSDSEFWNATPRMFCFSLISLAKQLKEIEKANEKKQTQNCINFLNGIKKML